MSLDPECTKWCGVNMGNINFGGTIPLNVKTWLVHTSETERRSEHGEVSAL